MYGDKNGRTFKEEDIDRSFKLDPQSRFGTIICSPSKNQYDFNVSLASSRVLHNAREGEVVKNNNNNLISKFSIIDIFSVTILRR